MKSAYLSTKTVKNKCLQFKLSKQKKKVSFKFCGMIVLWEKRIWLEHNEEEDGDCLDTGGAPGYFSGLNIYSTETSYIW